MTANVEWFFCRKQIPPQLHSLHNSIISPCQKTDKINAWRKCHNPLAFYFDDFNTCTLNHNQQGGLSCTSSQLSRLQSYQEWVPCSVTSEVPGSISCHKWRWIILQMPKQLPGQWRRQLSLPLQVEPSAAICSCIVGNPYFQPLCGCRVYTFITCQDQSRFRLKITSETKKWQKIILKP
jgi:hypothetical protein